MPEHTLNNSFCCKPVCGIFPLLFPFIIIHVWNIPFDLMISENSKSDSSSQLDEKEEDEELFFPGCSKKTKRGRTGSPQMLNYLSRKHENSMQIKERRLNLEERKLQLEEKKMALEEMKWKMMMSGHANTQNDLWD